MDTVILALLVLLALFAFCVYNQNENLSFTDLNSYYPAYINDLEPSSVRLEDCQSQKLRVPPYSVDMRNIYFTDQPPIID